MRFKRKHKCKYEYRCKRGINASIITKYETMQVHKDIYMFKIRRRVWLSYSPVAGAKRNQDKVSCW